MAEELLAIVSRVEPLLLPDLAPSPPPSPPRSSSTRPTKRSHSAASASDSRPRPPLPRPPPPPPVAASEWRTQWPKERLRSLGAECRDHGRRLKHSGDALASRSPGGLLALAHQLDAILLYVFAFWCDDSAAKACIPANWSSVFGLIGFVKKAAEKESQAFLTGICLRMEAIALYTVSMHEQKALFYKATHLASSSSSSSSSPSTAPSPRLPRPPPPPPAPLPSTTTTTTTAPSPVLLHPSPPGPPPPPPPPPPPRPAPLPPPPTPTAGALDEFVQKFLRASPDLFRFQKLYDESCALLDVVESPRPPRPGRRRPRSRRSSSSHLSQLVLPNPPSSSMTRTRGLGITAEEGELDSDDDDDDDDDGVDAEGPIELARGTGSPLMVPSQVSYCRTLLSDWTRQKGLDYEFCTVGAEAGG
ncbi:hypothetical protein JCM11491_005949 [Sporobolomyces phaffii]